MPDFDFTDFKPEAEGYVPANAYWLARCADLAYEIDPAWIEAPPEAWRLRLPNFRFLGETANLDETLRQTGQAEAETVLAGESTVGSLVGKVKTMAKGAGTEGFVAGNDKLVIVCFRGTEELVDYATDAAARPLPHAWGTVWGTLHTGFATAFSDSVRQALIDAVGELAEGGRGIWVTGHSLGGALATLAAAELAKAEHEIQGVYTFGQPRVGDQSFAKAYDDLLGKRHFRFVNNNDVVTEVPPKNFESDNLTCKYRHVGQRIYIKRTRELTDDIGKLVLTIDRMAGWVEAAKEGDLADGVSDHKMAKYVAALAQNYAVDPTA